MSKKARAREQETQGEQKVVRKGGGKRKSTSIISDLSSGDWRCVGASSDVA